jgi:hypothetical protein
MKGCVLDIIVYYAKFIMVMDHLYFSLVIQYHKCQFKSYA